MAEDTFAYGVCTECHGRVQIEIDTDNHGHLVEWVRPCKTCIASAIGAVNMAVVLQNEVLATIDNATSPGLELSRRLVVKSPHRVCPDCGEKSKRKKGQKRMARCAACAKAHTTEYRRQYQNGSYMRLRYGTSGKYSVCPVCDSQRDRVEGGMRVSRCPDCRANKRHAESICPACGAKPERGPTEHPRDRCHECVKVGRYAPGDTRWVTRSNGNGRVARAASP